MLLRQLRTRLFSSPARRPARAGNPLRSRLALERLESRDTPAVTFNPIQDFTVPGGKDLFVPLSAVDSGGQAVTYTAGSSNGAVTATVLTGGTFVDLHVKGTKGDGTAFEGDLVLRLFDDIAPQASARIVSLVNSGFFNNNNFHRVIDTFMAQGGSVNGTGGGESALGTFDDEFNSRVTFVSPGLLALANRGDDTNDTGFFITDPKDTLAQMHQDLNFNYTIFGQLVSGFDIFQDIMGTQVQAQSASNTEVSKPVNPVTIVTATVIADNHDSVLRISEAPSFAGTSSIVVTAASAAGPVQQTFGVNVVPDTVNDRAFLGAVANQTTTVGTAVTFDLPATDLEADQLTFAVRDPINFGSAPAHATVGIDQANHRVTLTPDAGFTGTVDLLVGVRDQTDRSGTGDANDQSNFDTQHITLTVTGGIDLNAASDDGLYNDDNYTSIAAPSFTIHAPAGETVTVGVNGTGAFATTETSAGAYALTLPAGTLQVGDNTISATATGESTQTLDPLHITYAPRPQDAFVVPGAPGSAQQMTFRLGRAESAFTSEIGLFVVDDADGSIGTLTPGSAGYAQAALARRVVIETRDQTAGGTSVTLSLQGAQHVGFYLIANSSADAWLSTNPTNQRTANGMGMAYFSFAAANPDGIVHVHMDGDRTAGRLVVAWEDLIDGGDQDYNDRIFTIDNAVARVSEPALSVPAGAARDVSVNFQLLAAAQSAFAGKPAGGEVGYFLVDSPDGAIGSLHPGDAGYAQAALTASHVVFGPTATANATQSAVVPGGSLLGFYFVRGSTAAAVLANNPTDAVTGSAVAYFSFAAANPDGGTEHFRTTSPEGVTEPVPTPGGPLRFHAMGTANGGTSTFDDVLFTVKFGPALPVASSVVLTPSDPKTGDTLTATAAAAAAAPGGSAVSLTYVWTVDGVLKRQVTLTATTDTFDLSQAGNGDKGQVVKVEVTPSTATTTGASVSATTTVVNSPPKVDSVALTPTPVFNDTTLTATVNNPSDADNDPVTWVYSWKVNGTEVQNSGTTTSPTNTLSLSSLKTVHPSDVVTVAVTPSDGTVAGTTVLATATAGNRTPQTQGIADQVFTGPGAWNFNVAINFSDPDGDALTFSATKSDASPLPAWLTFAPDGTFSGTPSSSDNGAVNLKVTATDPSAAAVSATFQLTVNV